MDFPEFTIAPKVEGKGRAFRALRVHAVMADALWDVGTIGKRNRPVMATFMASDGELRPFIANLLSGREAIPSGQTGYSNRSGYEFMRSAGWAKPIWAKFEEGSVCTIQQKDLLDQDPGMVDPKGVKFVMLPGKKYLADEAKKMDVAGVVAYARRLPIVEEENEPERDHRGHLHHDWKKPLTDELFAEWVPLAYLFTLYLANRSRAPIPPDGRFYIQLMIACLKRGLASFPVNDHHDGRKFGRNDKYKFSEEGGSGKFAPGVAFMAEHEELEQTLAGEIEIFFARTEGK